MSDDILSVLATGAGKAIVEFVVEHGFPALGSFVTGGAGGALLSKYLTNAPLVNADFKIITEKIGVTLLPDEAAKDTQLKIKVEREFTLQLRDQKKKGSFQLRAEIRGNNISGTWGECVVFLNDTESLGLKYEDDRAVVKAEARKLTAVDRLKVTLRSTEVISKKRGFYALIISNPKDKTTFHWEVSGLDKSTMHVRAFASSEDFDLLVLPPGTEKLVYESSHQVTYFLTWSEGLFV